MSHFQANAQPYIELKSRGQVQQFSLTQDEHRLGRDRQWADFALPDEGWDVLSSRHAVFRRNGNHYWIYDGDGTGKSSTNGTFAGHRRITPQNGYLLDRTVQIQIGLDPRNQVVLTYVAPGQGTGSSILSKLQLNLQSLQEWPVELGREVGQRYAAMELPSPTVSRRHATINREASRYILRNLSTNGTFINQQRIEGAYALQERDTIQIGPFTLLFREGVLELADRGDQIRIDAHRLVRKVRSAKGEKVILNDVSIGIEPGQLVAFVGGSGAGKTTLMRTLLGIEPTTSGRVLLNGEDLRQHFDRYRSEIGYVPQDDIIHQTLTVEEVLTYACQLRLPPDTDIPQAVGQVLQQVQLNHVRQTLVQNLSGGQRKRVSIAVELLANPKLFFLDEPTSGLDPGLDKTMMNLLRELADQGRTIILVTHATSNLEVCDRIAFMGQGGHLCYFGPPQDALTFFEMPSHDFKYFADIYIELDKGETGTHQPQAVELWARKFLKSAAYQSYVASVLSGEERSAIAENKGFTRQSASSFSQWWVLSQRYLKLVLRDRFSLTLILLTAPAGIALITFVVKDRNPLAELATPEAMQAPFALRILFVFTCAAMWVGLSSTAQAIVQEASIYARERLVNLGLFPYLGSKVAIHAGLAIVQAMLAMGVILLSFKSPEPELLPWIAGCGITTFLTLMASLSFGLMVSAFVKNPIQANSMLPLILIPQIVFSGVLFDLDGMSQILSWLMISRWSIGAYGSLVDVNAMIPQPPATPPGITPPTQPFEATSTYEATWDNLSLNWEVLCLLSLIYLGITLWRQKLKD
jgi:ABC transport system ATP-binding/permease protein